MQRSAVLALQLTRAMENKQISCCQLTRAKINAIDFTTFWPKDADSARLEQGLPPLILI